MTLRKRAAGSTPSGSSSGPPSTESSPSRMRKGKDAILARPLAEEEVDELIDDESGDEDAIDLLSDGESKATSIELC